MITLVVSKVVNGYMISHQNGDIEVFEETDSEAQTFARLLWAISNDIGPSTSRYSQERVTVEVKPGDKYEGTDQETNDVQE
jgi:hypothetical protein